LLFTFLSFFLLEADGVEKDHRYIFAFVYVNQFKPSYYVFELLILHFLREDTEEVFIEIVLFDVDRRCSINFFDHFLVTILRIFHQLSSNQCVLISVKVVFELLMYPHLFFHIYTKLISTKVLSIMHFYLFKLLLFYINTIFVY
jgi:hypothetical protein